MNFRIENRWFTFYIGLKRIQMVDGYNSILPDGKHFLMWDFDDTKLEAVKAALREIQKRYKLPIIWLLNTGIPDSWHANCFKALEWEECRSVVAATKYVDKKFVGIGILRGFFTLRYSPMQGREFQPAIILPSIYPEDINPLELTSFITYSKVRRR